MASDIDRHSFEVVTGGSRDVRGASRETESRDESKLQTPIKMKPNIFLPHSFCFLQFLEMSVFRWRSNFRSKWHFIGWQMKLRSLLKSDTTVLKKMLLWLDHLEEITWCLLMWTVFLKLRHFSYSKSTSNSRVILKVFPGNSHLQTVLIA